MLKDYMEETSGSNSKIQKINLSCCRADHCKINTCIISGVDIFKKRSFG